MSESARHSPPQLSRSLWSSLVSNNYDEMYTALQREAKLYGVHASSCMRALLMDSAQ